jgi:hypothetical protein
MIVTEFAPGSASLWKSRVEYAPGCVVAAGREHCSEGDIFFRTYRREAR